MHHTAIEISNPAIDFIIIETLNLEIVQVFSLNQNVFDFFYVHKLSVNKEIKNCNDFFSDLLSSRVIWRLKQSSIHFFVKYFFRKHIFKCSFSTIFVFNLNLDRVSLYEYEILFFPANGGSYRPPAGLVMHLERKNE